MMRYLLGLTLLLVVLTAAIASGDTVAARPAYEPKSIPTSAVEICVERPEENGSVNIVPVTVLVAGSSRLTLLGGEAGCLFLTDGTWTISLSFPYPYDLRRPRVWTTPARSFESEPGSVVRFELCEAANQRVNDPAWAVRGWHDMWIMRRVSESSTQRCAR
jgi:hypothetical protein